MGIYAILDAMHRLSLFSCLILMILSLPACAPTVQGNVLGYLLADRLGTLHPAQTGATGTLEGTVVGPDGPVSGASVLVAERTGRPHSTRTDAQGRYRIEGIPSGHYVPAAVAPGYDESALTGARGPQLVRIEPDQVTQAPQLHLREMERGSMPMDPAKAFMLEPTGAYTSTAAFPPGATADVQAFQVTRDGVVNDTLRVYTPRNADPAASQSLPLLFAVYPGVVDGWAPVSTALAAQGYAVVAVAPVSARGTDVDAHAEDARMALDLARRGALDSRIDVRNPVALGGSFSSAILHRLLRVEGDRFAGWVTVGGFADAFAGADAFYAGEIALPEQYRLLIPALGNPSIFPTPFLKFSPLYSAADLPPTLIIHTDTDRIVPIAQAYALEAALKDSGVPVETFYYDDVSHYLQIEEHMTDAGKEMFFRVLDFIQRYQQQAESVP